MPQSPIPVTIAKNPANAQIPLITDKQDALVITQLHGRKYLAAYNGELFHGANPSGVTTSAGLATTYVGLCLSNPAGSLVNLAVRLVTAQFIVAPATVTGIGLIKGYAAGGVTVHTTPLVPASSLIGTGPAPSGLLDSACTIVGTPAWLRYLAETPTATTLPFASFDMEGGIILPPGAYLAIGTTIAGPASGFVGSMEWEEFPI